MSRKQALTDLLVKVEAGEFAGTPGGEFRPRFNAFITAAEAAFGQYEPVGLPELAWRAHEGLPNTAKALHEAMLAGWGVSIDVEPHIDGGWRVKADMWNGQFYPLGKEVEAEGDDEARVRLICILKALIAECEE